jgi:hypothetical protein
MTRSENVVCYSGFVLSQILYIFIGNRDSTWIKILEATERNVPGI